MLIRNIICSSDDALLKLLNLSRRWGFILWTSSKRSFTCKAGTSLALCVLVKSASGLLQIVGLSKEEAKEDLSIRKADLDAHLNLLVIGALSSAIFMQMIPRHFSDDMDQTLNYLHADLQISSFLDNCPYSLLPHWLCCDFLPLRHSSPSPWKNAGRSSLKLSSFFGWINSITQSRI